jgi:uncharacterized membrane protein (Fun14 family)
MITIADDTVMRFLIVLIAGPMLGWALGYFIRKSIKVIAFIGGMFFSIIGILYYSKTIDIFFQHLSMTKAVLVGINWLPMNKL